MRRGVLLKLERNLAVAHNSLRGAEKVAAIAGAHDLAQTLQVLSARVAEAQVAMLQTYGSSGASRRPRTYL